MHKAIIISVLLMVSIPGITQEKMDSVRVEQLIEDLKNDISNLSFRYNQLNNSFQKQASENINQIGHLVQTDSLQKIKIRELEYENELIEKKLTENESYYETEIAALDQELYQTRKANIIMSIVIFFLLIILFVYFFYRNYRMEVYFGQEIMKTSLEIRNKLSNLKFKLNKRIGKKAETIDKKVEKRIKKMNTTFNKEILKIRKKL